MRRWNGRWVLVLILLCACVSVQAQDGLKAEGKVVDATTGKGVKAKIFYKSYPTGSITGRFNDSLYSFSIFGSSRYFITATADGYIEGSALIDPKDIDASRRVVRNIVMTKKGENIVLDHLIFEQGKAVINPSSFPQLDEVVAMMKTNEKLVIQLEGHTDSAGDAKANMSLSQDRVDNVRKYLIGKGVEKDRVKTKAFGGTQPLVSAQTPEARARNRRVEMRILSE